MMAAAERVLFERFPWADRAWIGNTPNLNRDIDRRSQITPSDSDDELTAEIVRDNLARPVPNIVRYHRDPNRRF